MSLITVSDLHITGSEDPLYASLLRLIRERAQGGDTLVLAGDLFDLFVGSKLLFIERYRGFFEALGEASRRGIEIHYIEGNHDFLIRGAFSSIPAVRVHSHDVSVEVGPKRFFFAHGDTVDREDYLYLFWRAIARSLFMRALVAAVPGKWVDRIGKFSSRSSRGHKPLLPASLPTERIERLRKIYRSYAAERIAQGYDFVVLGHCHDLDEMGFQIDGRQGQYINCGYPRTHGSYLSWSEGEGKIQRERLL